MSEFPQPSPSPDTARPPELADAVSGTLGKLIVKSAPLFAVGFLIAMGVLIFEIFMRHVLNRPTLWAHETTTFISAVGFIFAGLYCAARDKHIRVVILYDIAGPKMRKTLDVAISIICMISSGFFAWAAWLMVERAAFTPAGVIRLETTGSAFNAPYPGLLKVFMLLVLIVLTIQFLVQAINFARRGPVMPKSADGND